MKNKKSPKVKTVKAVSKKKNWPWLFVVAAILVVAVVAAVIASEFFTAPRCGDHCAAYINYLTIHYMDLVTLVAIVAGALILLAIICGIIANRKRKVVVKAPRVKAKKVKAVAPQYLAKGVFKKKAWPWLFVVAAILVVVVVLGLKVAEFSTASKCGDHCSSAIDYITIHYANLISLVAIIAGALVVVAILGAILFVRKRTLTLSASELTYKKGRKVVNIPLDSIQNIEFCNKGIVVTVPHVKFKFTKLKNKKEMYDALLAQTNAPTSVTTTTVIAPNQSLTAMAAPLLANPTLEGKLAYFGKLRESGLITKQQYDKYIDQSYKADC